MEKLNAILMFTLHYHYLVVRDDIPKLSNIWRQKIKQAIESKPTLQPEIYGKPLRRSLRGYRKLRVGDYRIIFRIDGGTVKILIIGHRSKIYTIAEKRI